MTYFCPDLYTFHTVLFKIGFYIFYFLLYVLLLKKKKKYGMTLPEGRNFLLEMGENQYNRTGQTQNIP